MAGPTDVLTEDVKDLRESNRRLADEMRESNRQLADEIRRVFDRLSSDMRDSNQRLTDSLGAVSKGLADLRVEVAKDLGVANENFKEFRGRTETTLKAAGRGFWTAVAASVGLIGSVITGTWYASDVHSKVVHLQESAKEQNARIAKIESEHRDRQPVIHRDPIYEPYSPSNVPPLDQSPEPPGKKATEPEKKADAKTGT